MGDATAEPASANIATAAAIFNLFMVITLHSLSSARSGLL